MQGTVKNFWKSYGFICGENDKEYFVHYSNLKAGYKRLHSGDYVEFTPVSYTHLTLPTTPYV